jgi:diguanylate cyclase (GGDEF)-like protein
MSLRNQFLIGSLIVVLTVFIMLFVGMGVRLQHYFQAQLGSHAQDTATSLAVAVNSALVQQDTILLETTAQAIFDSGYYKRIAILDATGKVILEKYQPPTNGDVPKWLPQIVKLDSPLRSAFITAGWRQAGVVEVTSQPAFAYRELWQLLQDAALWLTAAIIFSMLLMATLVRSILRPLDMIEKAALAVSRRQFPAITPIPQARELSRVVNAFNTLSSSVRLMLGEAENLAEQFRKQSLADALTGADNRRSLIANIESLLESPQGEYALALIDVNGLAELNTSAGRETGDKFVIALAATLNEVHDLTFLARIQGSSFALLLQPASADALQVALDAARLRIENICHSFGLQGENHCSAGAVRLFFGLTTSETMAKADEALARAHRSGNSVVDWAQSTGMPSGQWESYLQEAMRTNRFVLYAQQVIGYTDDEPKEFADLLHLEIYSRLRDDDGQVIKAARFMPMAIRHTLSAEIDRHCLRQLFRKMRSDGVADKRYAFNLSHESLCDIDFPDWLVNQLSEHSLRKDNLILEVSEGILHGSPREALRFSHALLERGLSFGIDQFGLHKGTVSELADLHPTYFKLATELTRQCAEIEEYGEYIAWLVKTAEILGVTVIATCVEKRETMERLVKAGVTGFQGHLIGPVASLDDPEDVEQD